ncbi:fungal versatile peroxidase from pleurotus Eryngii [Flammula alnicola]|nr:fungal versatile peroxidase from pleurotus Eryngii [Flammula alnicola]
MAFKNALSALVFALPLVLGLPGKRALNPKCDFLLPIREDLLENLFDNECGDSAHGALRLIFHDAIGISPTAGHVHSFHLTFAANDGLDDVLDDVGPFLLKYAHVLSPGDFIQFAGALSLANCPGAPRVKFALGRPQPKAASPDLLVPEPFDDVTKILERFASVGFSPQEVISLLSSHSIAGADTVDPTLEGVPFDSTPSTFDTNIFIEVLLKGFLFPGTSGNQGEVMSAINGTLRLQSDDLLARDPRTACIWQSFATNHDQMQAQFGAGVFKLSLLGQNEKELTDCSDVIPQPPSLNNIPTFPPGQTLRDIQQSCAGTPFPNLRTQPGPALDVPPM